MAQFVDEATVEVTGGKGGDGCVAFRREKHVPLGGPAGGDGGDGGDVVLEGDAGLRTLYDMREAKHIEGARGEAGRSKDQHGKGGKPRVVRVPTGTQVYDADTGALLADLDTPQARFVAARGGRGGRGNMRFATPTLRAPRHAEPGEPGESRRLRLSLKLIADVGVVGFPNVGKSTLIAAVSRARPKIADYPFTTLVPNLGVASLGADRSFVLADVPGLIEGAAEGAGLGTRFLRHVERTRVLLHVLALAPDPSRSPLEDFDVLIRELARHDPILAQRRMIVAVNKIDMPETQQAYPEIEHALTARGYEVHAVSAATGDGIDALLHALERALHEESSEEN